MHTSRSAQRVPVYHFHGMNAVTKPGRLQLMLCLLRYARCHCHLEVQQSEVNPDPCQNMLNTEATSECVLAANMAHDGCQP